MSDHIELHGLRVVAVHGLLEEERARAQPFELDLDVELSLAEAGRSDDLSASVSYAELARVAAAVLSGPWVALLETLAERVAQAVLALSPAVEAVTVVVRKLRPPVPFDLGAAGVCIRRSRD